ncbi:MAG TPA: baseplate J/gp47 family protein [Gammaproteobacteria bacterium]|nr:baseplate J/gp47 family protein [Gammaproteobacteria bacterium]
MFQIKDFRSIVASMVNYVRGTSDKLTDFSVGSVNRTMLEAPALEIDELYQQVFNGLREAIPAAIYPPFGFDKLQPVTAATNVIFSTATPAASAIVIPAGFAVRVPGGAVRYATQQQAVIGIGDTEVAVRVIADTEGVAGNTIAGTITEMIAPIQGVTVTNPAPVTTGRELETDQERFTRFQQYILSLARSHVQGVQYGASTAQVTDDAGDVIETVRKVLVVEPFVEDPAQPLGYIDAYLWNGIDSASPALLAAASKVVNGYTDANGNRIVGYKGAGVIVRIKPVVEQYINSELTVWLAPSYKAEDVLSQITAVISSYITGLGIGETYVDAEAVRRVKNIAGIYDVEFATPPDNLEVDASVKLLAGPVSITVA